VMSIRYLCRAHRAICMIFALSLAAILSACSFAEASVPGPPAWTIRMVSQPAYFSPTTDAGCEAASATRACDSYTLIVTNVGASSTGGRISIADELPAGVHVVGVQAEDLDTGQLSQQGQSLQCDKSSVVCTDETAIAPGNELLMTVFVTLDSNVSGSIINRASVAGGGATATTVSEATTINAAQIPFGVTDFAMQSSAEDGSLLQQAGGHPFAMLTSLDLNTALNTYSSPEYVRDVVVDLPLGLVGNPLAAPRCSLHDLEAIQSTTLCPKASRIGTVILRTDAALKFPFVSSDNPTYGVSALYNLEPEPGYPAEFGFTDGLRAVGIYASLVRVDGRYSLRAVSPGIPTLGITGSTLIFFGDPAERDGGNTASKAFFTNPVDCSTEPLKASIRADSWQHPARRLAEYTAPLESVVYPDIAGCNMLEFQPSLEATPETTQADEPTGDTVKIRVPQNESPTAPGTPELRNATVTLPAGVTLSPSAAEGLRACKETGAEGINIEGPESTEMGEGGIPGSIYSSSPYHDSQEHLAPGHCPAASTVGSVEVSTPVLPNPLEGHLFLAEPKCGGAGQRDCREADATNGNLFGVYLEASGAGAIVKLRGTASVNPLTGQMTTTFSENPQLPFGELTLHIKGGPRAALANPQTCGQATTTSDLTPWSAPTTPDATPFNSFMVDWDGGGGGCPAGGWPLAPTFSAGTVSPAAGAFTPFTLTLTRGDREQDVSQIAVHTPPGLLGMLSKVPLCEEPQAGRGECSPVSRIGSTIVAAGSGPHPFWVQGGQVYLTGPYKGAPFGLSIVVPAVAGPFNLGNVVVRATINADPNTTALTVTSDPLPQILDGVPLRVRTVNVTIDQPGFMFNPTNCSKQQITGTVAGA
jgi:hypothetical protein